VGQKVGQNQWKRSILGVSFLFSGKEIRRVSQRTCKPNKPNEKRINPRLLLVFYLSYKPDYGD
jgi:hypothetical protein